GAAGAAGPGLSRADPGQSWTVVTSGNVNMRGGVWDVDHVQITSGRLRMENSAEFAGGVNTTMQIDSGAELSWGNPNQPITVAALTGGGEVVSRQSGEWTFRVNAGEDHTFEGRITQQESARRTALTLDGSATWTLTGNDHDYTGITNIDGGTLRMNGIVLEGTDADVTDKSWHVNDGGGLGGIGEIRRDVFVNEGGTLRPGNSTGVLTLGDSSVGSGLSVNLTLEDGFLYEWEYDNGMADRDLVHVIGNLVLDGDHFTSGAGASVITLMNLGTGSLQIGDILFSTTEGILDGATPVTSGTLNWDVQDGSGFFAAVDGNNIVLVPEPGTLALLVIALGASFIASRRRK
ncbi:MAG: autotransporter-associated beta strand repeat-containing protein, partial [Kiritimatiellae bacterium]|nr:autotransporter-associated beta strand repeat-containing protein [Kiritimatiellia bacterium]